MADSLFDFGNVAQLAQGNLRNAMQMHQMEMQEQGMRLRNDRFDLDERKVALDERNAKWTEMQALEKAVKDPTIAGIPKVRHGIYARIANLAGAPPIDFDDIRISDIHKRDYIQTMMKAASGEGSADDLAKSMGGYALLAGPEAAKDLALAVKDIVPLRGVIQAAEQTRELNQGKVDELREHNARVAIAKPQYAQAALDIGNKLRVMESDSYKTGMILAEKDATGKWKADGKGRAAMQNLPDLRLGKGSEHEKAEAERDFHKGLMDNANTLLFNLSLNKPLPQGVTEQDLRTTLDVSGALYGAYNSLAQFYKNPFDKGVRDEVKAAFRTVNSRRIQTEALEKNADAERIRLQEEVFAAGQEKEARKNAADARMSRANQYVLKQHGYSPTAQQLSAAAVKFGVDPADMMKGVADPEKKGKLSLNLLSPGMQEKVAEERTMVGQVDELIRGFNPKYVGVLDSRVGQLGQMTATLGQEREAWLQKSRALLSSVRHAQYGASLTDNELASALSELPNESMGDNQWKAAAIAWRDHWGRLIDKQMGVAKESRGIDPGKPSVPSSPPKPHREMTDDELMRELIESMGGSLP